MARRWIIVAVTALVAVALLSVLTYRAGYDAGLAKGREDARVQVDWKGSRAQADDAIRRWIRKTNRREMEDRYPYVMNFPDRNCIELKFKRPAVGGVPIYCYRAGSLELVEEHSDVE